MESKFFTFISPYLLCIDKGHLFRKPFSWLYAIIAIISLLLPLYILYRLVDIGLFSSEFKIIVTVLLICAVIAFVGWLSFQLWWERKTKITFLSGDGTEFVSTFAVSHFVQTLGEWIGTWVGLIGFGYALLTALILGERAEYLEMPIIGRYLNFGWIYVFLMLVCGFLIIVLTRFLAEQIKAIAAVANNIKHKQIL